jgi:hypothetical protein
MLILKKKIKKRLQGALAPNQFTLFAVSTDLPIGRSFVPFVSCFRPLFPI